MRTARLILLSIVVATALAPSGCEQSPAASAPQGSGARTPAAPAPSVAAVTEGSPTGDGRAGQMMRLPGMECLVNEFGIRCKVLTTGRDARCLDTVPNGTPGPSRLRLFTIYFVFDAYPREGPIQFFQIGATPRRDSVVGWVPASQVVRWDTRVAARYRRVPDGRTPPLLVYLEKEPLIELVKTGTTRAKPIARAVFKGGHTWMPWPIAETYTFQWEGNAYELVRLLFLAELKAGADLADPEPAAGSSKPRYTDAELAGINEDIRKLDVVFAMDVTGSMQTYIDAVKKTVVELSERLKGLDTQADVAFGLVAYRDYDGPSGFVTKLFDLSDHQTFLRSIAGVTANAGGDETEAVYDAVHDALAKASWRGSGRSRRVLILVGDCPGHEPGDPQNPRNISREQLVQMAGRQGKNARIFALAVGGQSGNALYDLRWQQFSFLASRTGGTCRTIENATQLVPEVRSIMGTQAALVHDTSIVVQELARGRSRDQIPAERGIDLREMTEIMEFLESVGVDAGRLGTGVPSFATGWCMTQVSGVPILDREVYVARAELDLLLSQLNELCMQLSPDLPSLAHGVGLSGRVNPMSFFATRRAEPMDVFLMAKGVPCSQGLLKLTRSDIEHMSEERRALLRERLARQVVPALVNARNNDQYFRFLDDLEFGWVPESILP